MEKERAVKPEMGEPSALLILSPDVVNNPADKQPEAAVCEQAVRDVLATGYRLIDSAAACFNAVRRICA